MLTKSNYLSAIQCKKKIWLEKNSSVEKEPLSLSDRRRIEEGNRVGEQARRARGEGVLIETLDWNKAVEQTNQAIERGEERIFEAAFVYNNLAVRLDIIEKAQDSWNLFEVKASTSKKSEYITDISFQNYVASLSGLKIHKNELILINKEYLKDNSKDLFVYKNVDEEVGEYLKNIGVELEEIENSLKSSNSPKIHVSRHCKKPEKCVYWNNCWAEIPEKSIFTIPRLHKNKEADLIKNSIIKIKDIVEDLKLSKNQEKYVNSVISNKPVINREGIKQSLEALQYPLYFFDIETAQDAIPRFKEVAPYTQMCFQFSCHVLEGNGKLEHFEFLHTDDTDPRKPFLNKLIETLKEEGSIIVYHQTFEITRFKEFKKWFPEYSEELDNIISRVWDLEVIFKNYYMHPDFNGKTSIKSVLPVLVPELNYSDLEISRGDIASAIWSKMIYIEDNSEKEKINNNLLEYCKLDTLAMVEIYEVLRALI